MPSGSEFEGEGEGEGEGEDEEEEEDEDEEEELPPAIEKQHRRKEKEEKEDTRIRKPPKATGHLRDPTCKRCIRLEQDCLLQAGGRACVACARVKIRCIGADDSEPEPKEKAKEKAKKTKAKETSAPRSAPRKAQKSAPREEPSIKSKPKKAVKSVAIVYDDSDSNGADDVAEPPKKSFAALSKRTGRFLYIRFLNSKIK